MKCLIAEGVDRSLCSVCKRKSNAIMVDTKFCGEDAIIDV
jgi:hypothetical protein